MIAEAADDYPLDRSQAPFRNPLRSVAARLAAEMIDLLLIEHSEEPVGPRRGGAGAKRGGKSKPGHG